MQTDKQHYSELGKTKTISAKIRNETKKCLLVLSTLLSSP
jgi:hypothetical protein